MEGLRVLRGERSEGNFPNAERRPDFDELERPDGFPKLLRFVRLEPERDELLVPPDLLEARPPVFPIGFCRLLREWLFLPEILRCGIGIDFLKLEIFNSELGIFRDNQ